MRDPFDVLADAVEKQLRELHIQLHNKENLSVKEAELLENLRLLINVLNRKKNA